MRCEERMRRKKDGLAKVIIGCIVTLSIAVGALAITLVVINTKKTENGAQGNNTAQTFDQKDNQKEGQSGEEQLSDEQLAKQQAEAEQAKRQEVIDEATLMYQQYNYKAAIKKIKKYDADYAQDTELNDLVTKCKDAQEGLSLYGAFDTPDQISHVFFHSLIADTSKAFDGDHMENGYNYWMTTVDEFNKMMQQMYDNGYVLVSIHDVAHEEKQEDGSVKMVPGDLMLPKDKKPFVLSQDDTNYYEYMQTDGFAKRIVIDEDGYPACEMEVDGKIVTKRDFDVVPLLEKFIEEHPDFSYRGARGIIGVTGYEGVMGYRINDKTSKTYEQDLKQAKETAKALRAMGWVFASHSYGHGHMGKKSAKEVKEDSIHWDEEDASVIGKTDIYLFPYGEDIQEGIGTYEGEKYETLYNLGFRYYCGVYSKPWTQVKEKYVRMTRRNLDGYTMHFNPDRLEDLFSVKDTMDPCRPEFK